MNMFDTTHEFSCTDCRHTGRPCMEGIWLAQRLCQSIAEAGDDLPEGYDFSCSSQFEGCGRTCHTILRVTKRDVQVFCGTEPMGVRIARDGFGMTPPTAAGLPAAMVVGAPLPAAAERLRAEDGLRLVSG
jgi:hypothetical protein